MSERGREREREREGEKGREGGSEGPTMPLGCNSQTWYKTCANKLVYCVSSITTLSNNSNKTLPAWQGRAVNNGKDETLQLG